MDFAGVIGVFFGPGSKDHFGPAVTVQISHCRRGLPAGFAPGGITARLLPFQLRRGDITPGRDNTDETDEVSAKPAYQQPGQKRGQFRSIHFHLFVQTPQANLSEFI